MEEQVEYLPPKYEEKFLPPIINEVINPNYIFESQKSDFFNSPKIPPTTITEYQSTSESNQNFETNSQYQFQQQDTNQQIISEYQSTAQPNLIQETNLQYQIPSQSNIIQETISEDKSITQPNLKQSNSKENNLNQETNIQFQPISQSYIIKPVFSEYESTSKPNIKHSTSQPNLNQKFNIQFQSPSQSNIIQPIISEYESTAQPNLVQSTSHPNPNQENNPQFQSSPQTNINQPNISENQSNHNIEQPVIQENQAISPSNANQPTSQENIKHSSIIQVQDPSPQNNQLIISEYKSTSPPNLSKSNIIEPIITRPMDSHLTNQVNINQSIVSRSTISQQLGESIEENPLDTQKSIANTILIQPINNQQNILSILRLTNQQPINPINNKSIMGKIPGVFPVYRLIRQGNGINPTEQQGIVFCAMKVYQEEILPLSNNTARFIQRKIGGDWLVIVYEQGKPIDFNMTCVEGNDYLYFILDTTAYQVCRLG